MKQPKRITVGKIVFQQLVLWSILHAILGFCTFGIWLLFGWVFQVIDLCIALNMRSKYAEWERLELIKAIKGGKGE